MSKIAPNLSALVTRFMDEPGVIEQFLALVEVAKLMRRQIEDIDERFPDVADGDDVKDCRRALARLSRAGRGRGT